MTAQVELGERATVASSTMEAMEIDMAEDGELQEVIEDVEILEDSHLVVSSSMSKSFEESEDGMQEADEDMKGLLAASKNKKKQQEIKNVLQRSKLLKEPGRAVDLKKAKRSCSRVFDCCCATNDRFGNLRVIFPSIFDRTGWGIAGPHWFGPPCVVVILVLATVYFVHKSVQQDRIITAAICVLLALMTFYQLISAAYRDPGIVRPKSPVPDPLPRDYRWCDVCQTYQPPHGAHCPDCNVCVAGFDHHCVWMGTCIGRNNFQPFVRFNLSWLLYLIFAVVWVSILGPFASHYRHH